MARKDFDFKPDPSGTGILSKLYLTPRQRQTGLKWLLFALVCVVALVIQDSLFSRVTIFGGWLDLAPALIVLICIVQGPVSGSVFALGGSLIYVFSGSAPGPYCIVLLCFIGIGATLVRQAWLRRTKLSIVFSAGLALTLYELGLYIVGMGMGLTRWARIFSFLLTAAYSWAVMIPLYSLINKIGHSGGTSWKE